jgi:gluconokinase
MMGVVSDGETKNSVRATNASGPRRSAPDWAPALDGPEPPLTLALDIGTSGVRAALYDSQAREVEGTQTRTARAFCTTADGGSEANAETSVNEVVRVIDATLVRAEARLVSQIEFIALSCFWHSLVGVDRVGRAVTPVFGWGDTRAAQEAERLRRELDERETHARTGCRFHASYWPAKLLWIRKAYSSPWHRIAHWMSFSDFLMLRLCETGRAAVTSVSMASGTGLLRTDACAWDETLLDALDVSEKCLPRLVEQGETFRLAGEYQKRWPPLRACTLLPAIGDGAANNIGEGCTTHERVALMVGTSAAMRVVFEGAAPKELHPGLWCYRVDRHRIAVGGALSDGGGLHEWLSRTLSLGSATGVGAQEGAAPGAEIEEALAGLAPDAHGLTVLPFWAGERSTGWHADASGAILGLTAHTRPIEILRAGMEAVAYRLALISEALDLYAPGAEIRASGGALRASRVWPQIISDALKRRVTLSRVAEASSRGAVLLALEAQGKIKSVSDIPAPAGGACEPDEALHAVYRRAAERQQKFYELLVGDQTVAGVMAGKPPNHSSEP